MIDVAIIGAGDLGGSLAHVLARRECVRRIQLIDPSGQIASGKALDIRQTGPVEGFDTVVNGSTDLSRAIGADVVVIADQARPQADADPLLSLRQIAQLAARAIVICAGTDGRTLVERGVSELKYSEKRLFGTAPEALASAIRALVALQVDGSPRDVGLQVLGVPPAGTVVDWDGVTIAGSRATRVLTEPALRKLAAQLAPLWPPGPHALAHAAAEAVSAVAGRSRRRLSCYVAPDIASSRSRVIALPVRLSESGVKSVEMPLLEGAVKTALESAIAL